MNTEIHTPACVGFIMDGNRRWAKEHEQEAYEGHARGFEALKTLVRSVHGAGIPHMVCYAFSTENWNREAGEVGYLMELFAQALKEAGQNLFGDVKARVRFIGERGRFSRELQEAMWRVEEETKSEERLTIWIALSYGGRAEIVSAVNRAIAKKEQVSEESFEKLLWTSGMPDPDLIIRTGGEERLSNFLLWQSAYSELFFTDTLWPDFGETEFRSILEEYGKRERRRGR